MMTISARQAPPAFAVGDTILVLDTLKLHHSLRGKIGQIVRVVGEKAPGAFEVQIEGRPKTAILLGDEMRKADAS